MNKFYVYAGYCELYVSSKKLNAPYMYQGEFDSIKEAETFMAHNFDTDGINIFYERSIFPQCEYAQTLSFLDDEELESYRFDITDDGLVLQATNEYKKTNVNEKQEVLCNDRTHDTNP